MQIISISGLDGSGKSTQIQLLQKYLENSDKKVFYFHAVQFSVASILNRTDAINRVSTTDTRRDALRCVSTRDITKASWSKIYLRKIALFIDIFRFKLLVKKLKNNGYDYILTDRYFYDMIINIAYLSKKDYKPFFFTKIIVPNHKFYLSVNPKDIINRDNPPAQGLKYLKDKKELFDKYKFDFDLKEIDGNRDKQIIFKELKSII